MFERFSSELKIYDINMKNINTIQIEFEVPAFITSIAYDEENCIFAVASSDQNIWLYQKTITMELT